MSINRELSRAVPLAPHVAERPARRRTPRTFWGDVARRFWARRPAVAGAAFVLLALVLAALAPLVAPRGYAAQDYEHLRSFPSALYWLGTDTAGRDLWARIVYGARVSLLVGLVVQSVAVLVGVPLGLIAGFCGGRVDALIMRVVDTFYAFPSLLFAILMMSWLGSGLQNVVIALSLTSWLTICRLVRAQTLSIREREFVTAAHAVGVPVGRILWAHIFPSTFSAIITSVTFGIPQAILAEATLSFIGIGINPPMPSWGQMVSDNILYIRSAWHLAVFPAVALGLTMLAFTALGDGLRDAFDPRDRK